MDWSNERYVRIYTRDTKTWKILGWEAQTVLTLLARRFDRAGLVDDVYNGEDVAIMLGYGFPVDLAEKGLQRLIDKEVWVIVEDGLFWPKFTEAQEAAQSDAQRARSSRERRKAKARKEASQNVTPRHETNENVTIGHTASQPVTLTRTVPNRAETEHIYSLPESDKDQLTNGHDTEVDPMLESDPVLQKIRAVVRKVAGQYWDPISGPVLVRNLREAYCGDGVDVDALVGEIRKDLKIRTDITVHNSGDVSRIINGMFRRFSRMCRTKPMAQSGPDAATVGYNAMIAVMQCIERGLAIEPDKLEMAYNTAIEDKQQIHVSVRRLVDNAVSAGWIERRPGSGKIERAGHYVSGETAETLSTPKTENSPEEIRRMIRESLNTGGTNETS